MFDISKLNSEVETELIIDEDITFDEETLKNTDIKRLENIHAKGKITRIEDSVYNLTLNITGNMVLLCARSLEEVNYPLDIILENTISKDVEIGEKQFIFQNSLDIFGIVWENIVLEVPLRVVKEDADFITDGNGWSLKDENEKENNSPLSELSRMLDMEGK